MREDTATIAVAEIVNRLIEARTSRGGWGWRSGQSGNTECTALAVLALDAHLPTVTGAKAAVEDGRKWLRSRQHAGGSWPMSDQVPEGSWMTGLAVLALAGTEAGRGPAVRGAEWLLSRESRGLPWFQRIVMRLFSSDDVVDQDSTLTGWPWTHETTAWVEPTAWSMLAVKTVLPHLPRSRASHRIDQAERMLVDRMCAGGGWNYGNKRIMGQELDPYPDTTALALIALQDRRSATVTTASLNRLRDMMRGNRTVLVLALAILAFQLHGEDVAPLRVELLARLITADPALDGRTLALALLALDDGTVHFRASSNA